jgi:hypothetical protein
LPENAQLSELPAEILMPNKLSGLWEKPPVTLKKMLEYFSGGYVTQVQKQGYEEALTIPKVERDVVMTSVSEAVKTGILWLTSGPASIWAEEIPAGLLTEDTILQAPPLVISSIEVLPDSLPDAWQEEITTALAISAALSKKVGQTLPWRRVREAIDGAIRARYLVTTVDSAAWPCEYPGAQYVRLRVPKEAPSPPPLPPPPPPGVLIADAELRPNEIQDLADALGDIMGLVTGKNIKFNIRIGLDAEDMSKEDVEKLNKILLEINNKLQLK